MGLIIGAGESWLDEEVELVLGWSWVRDIHGLGLECAWDGAIICGVWVMCSSWDK